MSYDGAWWRAGYSTLVVLLAGMANGCGGNAAPVTHGDPFEVAAAGQMAKAPPPVVAVDPAASTDTGTITPEANPSAIASRSSPLNQAAGPPASQHPRAARRALAGQNESDSSAPAGSQVALGGGSGDSSAAAGGADVPLESIDEPAAPPTLNWLQFRGPGGSGRAGGQRLPITWSQGENLLWRVPVGGGGASSPIVYGDQVIITCYRGYGLDETRKGQTRNLRRCVLCLSREDGRTLWQQEVRQTAPVEEYEGFVTQHGYASSTPVTDGEMAFAFFGNAGVFAFDLDADSGTRRLWEKQVGKNTHDWGSGASPVLFEDLVIINASVESGEIGALNKRTGSVVWHVSGIKNSWSIPLVLITEKEMTNHQIPMTKPQGTIPKHGRSWITVPWSASLLNAALATNSFSLRRTEGRGLRELHSVLDSQSSILDSRSRCRSCRLPSLRPGF